MSQNVTDGSDVYDYNVVGAVYLTEDKIDAIGSISLFNFLEVRPFFSHYSLSLGFVNIAV